MGNLPGSEDTIAAIATAAGSAGIGVIRLSGPASIAIAEAVSGRTLSPRVAHFATLRDLGGELLDEAVLITYPEPRSFTGENVAELQCHGSPVVLQSVLEDCLHRGARLAAPGEFSQRAFLNGKIDLVQAEAIADLISSASTAAARSALRSLSGAFSARVNELLQELISLRVYVEAAIDFPEEEIDFISGSDVAARLVKLDRSVQETLDTARRGRALHDGLKLVLAGVPNAGKSSLLNQLAGTDSAIVTPIPGTTRDVLRERIEINGLPLHIVDTAGLRESDDAVEQEGIRRAQREIESADRILLVIDDSGDDATLAPAELRARYRDVLPGSAPITVIHNKCDLSGQPPRLEQHADGDSLWLSARNGDGLDLLRTHLLDCAGLGGERLESEFSARARHITALERTGEHLGDARRQLEEHGAAELLAEDLRYAQDRLGTITGQFSSDDLLGEIFSSFCIGK